MQKLSDVLHTKSKVFLFQIRFVKFLKIPKTSSQCLQRTPSRGGKAGRAHVARRYRLLVDGDWGGLVELWEEDEERRRRRRRRKKRSSEEEAIAQRREGRPS